MKLYLKYRLFFMFPVIALTFFSCVNTRKATYFNDLKDSTIGGVYPVPESPIQKNDILSIHVTSLNPEASALFNPATMVTGSTGKQLNGYLVNQQGDIQFPVLGNITVAGLTKEQLKIALIKSLTDKKLLLDPMVSIRFLNFKVTVLGEVRNPSVLDVSNEKISLLEAIGLAGDLTIYAKRDNVLLIREDELGKTIKRIDLNTAELFTSPYYYLRSNDVIYVEPNKSKVASASRSQQWLPIVLSALSVAVIVADRVIKN